MWFSKAKTRSNFVGSFSGLPAAGVEAHGVEADGVEADGVEADGVEADGVEADGVEADGVEAHEAKAPGVEADGVLVLLSLGSFQTYERFLCPLPMLQIGHMNLSWGVGTNPGKWAGIFQNLDLGQEDW
jgi:hypothetical protein